MSTTVVINEVPKFSLSVRQGDGVTVALPQSAAPALTLSMSGSQGPTGPVGPAGQDAPVLQYLFDSGNPTYHYFGSALVGQSQAAASWDIRRITYNVNGVQTAYGDASDVTWTGRSTHTYT